MRINALVSSLCALFVASTTVVAEEGIRLNIYKTNFENQTHVRDQVFEDRIELRHWGVQGQFLIPVKHGNHAYAVHAMDTIEEVLGMTLFNRKVINELEDDSIRNGIIFSHGTAKGKNNSSNVPYDTGHVGNSDGDVSSPLDWIKVKSGPYSGVVKVNVGAGEPSVFVKFIKRRRMKEIAVHEFAHALGMRHHFNGFGEDEHGNNGPMMDANAWNALYNILNNAVGTKLEDMKIVERYSQ